MNVSAVYLDIFDCAGSVFEEFEVNQEALDGGQILLAYYSYEDYSGSAFVLFQKPDGSLWEVKGSHCSCYGLEGQWEPEATTIEALRHRISEGHEGRDRYWGGEWTNTYGDQLAAILDQISAEDKGTLQ